MGIEIRDRNQLEHIFTHKKNEHILNLRRLGQVEGAKEIMDGGTCNFSYLNVKRVEKRIGLFQLQLSYFT